MNLTLNVMAMKFSELLPRAKERASAAQKERTNSGLTGRKGT